MKIAVVGVGNEIISDDGVGLYTAKQLKKENLPGNVDVLESERGGIYLLDVLEGYDKAIIIDAIKSEKGKLGEIYKLSLDDFSYFPKSDSLHSVDIITGLKFYIKENIRVPDNIIIYSIEVETIDEFGVGLTPEVEKAAVELVEIIKKELKLNTD